MHPFRHTLSLRVWGEFDAGPLADLTGGDLPLVHKKAHGAIEAAGGVAVMEDDYYCQEFVQASDEDIEDNIYELLRSLEDIRSLGWSLSGTSRAEILITLYGDQNFGFTVKADLLSRLGELGLALAFDISPAWIRP